jgi:hypothetical protein
VSDFYDAADAPSPRDKFGPIFTATFDTECESCEDPIVPGEDARADGRGGWIHADDQCEKVASRE